MKIYIHTVMATFFLFILNTVIAVDRSKFRTCADTRYIYNRFIQFIILMYTRLLIIIDFVEFNVKIKLIHK